MELIKETWESYFFKFEKNEEHELLRLATPDEDGIMEVSKKILRYVPPSEDDRVTGWKGPLIQWLIPRH